MEDLEPNMHRNYTKGYRNPWLEKEAPPDKN